MGVNNVDYRAQLSADTARGPSKVIWGDCPVLEYIEDPSRGMYFFDDFVMAGNADMSSAYKDSIGAWGVYGYAGAQLTDGALEGGVLTYGSDGDNEGVAFMSNTGSFRLVTTSTLALNGKLWFEARIATSTVTATKHEDFVGLANPVLTSGLLVAANPIGTTDDTLSTTPHLIGFHRKATASPTEWSFVYQLAAGTAVYPTNLTTLMNTVTGAVATAAGFVKLGFLFDPNAYTKLIGSASTGQTAGALKRPLIRVFVNGLEAAAFLTSDNLGGGAFPTGFMAPAFANMNQTGTTPGTSSIDWIRVAQAANS